MATSPIPQLPLFDARGALPAFSVRASGRARRLTVRVYPGGRVEVTVPSGVQPHHVEDFVRRHRGWIDARVADLRTRPAAVDAALPTRVELQALGDAWEVSYAPRGRGLFRTPSPGQLEIRADPSQPVLARRGLRAWLAEEARGALEPWLRELATESGFDFERVQLRRQRTRWGSCSRSGTISLNVCLLFQPPDVVRYLLLHELCHTRHMNHSARYWGLVESLEPDYRALDRALTRGWQHVPAWLYGG